MYWWSLGDTLIAASSNGDGTVDERHRSSKLSHSTSLGLDTSIWSLPMIDDNGRTITLKVGETNKFLNKYMI